MSTSQCPLTRLLDLSSPSLPEWIANPNPEIYFSDNYIVLDFETYGGSFGDAGDPEAGIVLAAWLDGLEYVGQRESEELRAGVPAGIHSAIGGEYEQAELLARIRSADFIVAHNSKFELRWLNRMGCDPRKLLPYCTQIGEYVLLGNIRKPLGLDAVARRRGFRGKHAFAGACIKAGVDTRDIPTGSLLRYCENDVILTHQIFLQQRRELHDSGLLQVALGRNLVTPALAAIESEGMQLDSARVRDRLDSVRIEYTAASERLNLLTGGINFRSPKQMREFIYGKLGFEELKDRRGNPIRSDSGQPRTDKNTVEQLKARTPEQREFAKAVKNLAPLKKQIQILETLNECCEKDNGQVYANFNQTVTQTHRLSSSGGKYKLQFHNFPRAFKPLFRARDPGWLLCEADAPQLEFRVAVDLGNDARGKRDIREGVDVHQFTADVMGVSRQAAKSYTFKPLYGGNSGTPRERGYYQAFRERYPEVYRTQSGWTYTVLETKQLRTPSGLVFYWPDTDISKSGYITNTPSIFNYPVQMFATADIIPFTLALVWHQIGHLRVRIINTIHDSIIAEVHPDDLAEYKQILVDCFTNQIYFILRKLYKYDFTTPLGVGIKAAQFWGEGQEEKHERHS